MSVQTFNPNAVSMTLSDAAAQHFVAQLNQNPNACGVLFSVTKTGCSGYSYVSELIEQASEKDLPVSNAAGLKLFLEASAKPLLNGLEIDFVSEQLGQTRLVYNNPNETARCGCGESFSIDPEFGE